MGRAGRPVRPTAGPGPEAGRGRWLMLIGLGCLLGALNSASNYGLVPGHVYVAKAVGNDWTWLLAAYAASWGARSWWMGWRRAVAVLWPATMMYYLGDLWHLHGPGALPGQSSGLAIDVVFWLITSSVTAALTALMVVIVRRGGPAGVLATLAVPAYIAWRAFRTHRWLSREPSIDPALLSVTGVLWPVALAVTVLLASAGVYRLSRRS